MLRLPGADCQCGCSAQRAPATSPHSRQGVRLRAWRAAAATPRAAAAPAAALRPRATHGSMYRASDAMDPSSAIARPTPAPGVRASATSSRCGSASGRQPLRRSRAISESLMRRSRQPWPYCGLLAFATGACATQSPTLGFMQLPQPGAGVVSIFYPSSDPETPPRRAVQAVVAAMDAVEGQWTPHSDLARARVGALGCMWTWRGAGAARIHGRHASARRRQLPRPIGARACELDQAADRSFSVHRCLSPGSEPLADYSAL
jgi:hypothetical protein